MLHPPTSISPIRILTAVPICDGHDSAITTINMELIRAGVEVIYLGFHRSVADIARTAIQEDVRAVGLSSYNGGHVEFFAELVARSQESPLASDPTEIWQSCCPPPRNRRRTAGM